MLQKKLVKLFLAPREGQWVFFATTMTNDEKFGLTFSRSFCLLKLNVEKVGKAPIVTLPFAFPPK